MFMLIVILMVNIGLINKITNQEKEIAQITKNYNVTDNEMEQAYIEATSGEDRYLTMGEIRDIVYPVGSIYMSASDKNPGEIMGRNMGKLGLW